MNSNFITYILRCQVLKGGRAFTVSAFINICFFLDRIGRLFDAHQVAEIVITVFGYFNANAQACFVLLGWLFKLLTGA